MSYNIVYLFENKDGLKYIGSKRNCEVRDNKIFYGKNKNTVYYTSSTNKEFVESLKEGDYNLTILYKTKNKKENIIQKEREFHLKYDILSDDKFVNKAIASNGEFTNDKVVIKVGDNYKLIDRELYNPKKHKTNCAGKKAYYNKDEDKVAFFQKMM